MQAVLKALSTIITSHDREPIVVHRLVLVTRLADAMLGMIFKSSEEAERAKITVSPLLMAVQMAKLVIPTHRITNLAICTANSRGDTVIFAPSASFELLETIPSIASASLVTNASL